MGDKKDYDVGYGKPPKSGMFKKGQSGNPKGRKQGSRNFRTELEDVLNSKVTVTVSGRPTKVSTTEAAVLRLKDKALKGDQRSLEKLLSYAEEVGNRSDARAREKQLTQLEKDILGRFFNGEGAEGPIDE